MGFFETEEAEEAEEAEEEEEEEEAAAAAEEEVALEEAVAGCRGRVKSGKRSSIEEKPAEEDADFVFEEPEEIVVEEEEDEVGGNSVLP